MGEFLTFTGFSDKAILAIGTNANQSLKTFKVSDGAIVDSFGPIDTGANTSFTKYNSQYYSYFGEVP